MCTWTVNGPSLMRRNPRDSSESLTNECIRLTWTCLLYILRLSDIFVPLFESSFLLCDRFCIHESFPVVGFSPLIGSMGVFGKAFNHSLSNVLVHEGGDNAVNQAIGL